MWRANGLVSTVKQGKLMSIVDLADRRPVVCYTVRLAQYWDGREDVADDERTRKTVADALRRASVSSVTRNCPLMLPQMPMLPKRILVSS